jgi:hypothetical protein
MTRPNFDLQIAHSPVLRYGLERYHSREAAFPLFLLANAITCWYAGVRK